MNPKPPPGLGELLRYVGELVEQGADEHYRSMSLHYRARYTPVFRALDAGAITVTDITTATHLTQGAISQTVSLLEADGLITRYILGDGRKSGIKLTAKGQKLLSKLRQHWIATFQAIADLEAEIGYPLCQTLAAAADALKRSGFSKRLASANAAK